MKILIRETCKDAMSRPSCWNVPVYRSQEVLRNEATLIPCIRNFPDGAAVNNTNRCIYNILNRRLYNKLAFEEGVVATVLRDVTVTNHATNVTGVGIVVSTHIVVPLRVTNYETESYVKVHNSETRYVDRDSCLPR